METVSGQLTGKEALVVAGLSATYRVTVRTDRGTDLTVQVVVTGQEAPLAVGDRLQFRIAHSPAGPEVVFCRNATAGRVLVDRVNHEARRISVIALLVVVGLAAVFWIWVR